MVEVKEEYPFELNGEKKENLIKHYAEDENGRQYYILQVETGIEYQSAVDLYPCKYTYKATNKPIEETEE